MPADAEKTADEILTPPGPVRAFLAHKHIATVGADGVAPATIQGLDQKLEEQLKEKDARIGTLERRLADLEKVVASLAQVNQQKMADRRWRA